MRFYPFLLSLIIWGLSYHGMYSLTSEFWTHQDLYCKINAQPHEYNLCTKSVAIGSFMTILVPLGLAIGTYVIARTVEKKRKELIINE